MPRPQEHSPLPCKSALAEGWEELSPRTPPFAGAAQRPLSLSPPPAPVPARTSSRTPCPETAALQQRFARLQELQLERGRQMQEEQELDQFLASLGMKLPPPPPPVIQQGKQAGSEQLQSQASQQRLSSPRADIQPASPSPPPFPPAKGSDWEVRRVVGHRQAASGELYYWVQWGDSWVQQGALREDTLRAYWLLHGEEPPLPCPRRKQKGGKGRGSKAAAQPWRQPAEPSKLLELD